MKLFNNQLILNETEIANHTFALSESQIDIWQFSLQKNQATYLDYLSNDEKIRAKRFYFEKHQRRFTIARATIRIILGHYAKINPKSLIFKYTPHGKPYLNENSIITFNLSHSGNNALLAVGKKCLVGVDIECFSERPYLGIAKNSYSDMENLALKASPPYQLQALFFQIWAQKEAFIKALGLGLAYPTQSFSVSAQIPPVACQVTDTINQKIWQLHTWQPFPDAYASVCYSQNIDTINLIEII